MMRHLEAEPDSSGPAFETVLRRVMAFSPRCCIRLQAFGLVSTQASSEGVSGIAADTWNILWPDSTNQVTVGLVVAGSTNSSFTPQSVSV